jgi:hypothetical protein
MRDLYIDPRDQSDDGVTDELGLTEADYIWLSDRIGHGSGHAENVFHALSRAKLTAQSRALYDTYATNSRESGLEPMTWQEWDELDLLTRNRELLRVTQRSDDIADLY